MGRPQPLARPNDPRRTELSELKKSVRSWFALQDDSPDQTRWEMCDFQIRARLKRIAELEYVQEWEIDEEVELVRHQFRGQGL